MSSFLGLYNTKASNNAARLLFVLHWFFLPFLCPVAIFARRASGEFKMPRGHRDSLECVKIIFGRFFVAHRSMFKAVSNIDDSLTFTILAVKKSMH
jgi:hypothetical protein